MARTLHRLSDRSVKAVRPGMHCDGGGLYLQVTAGPDGALRRSWLFRYSTGEVVTSCSGKPRRVEREMGLGSYPFVGLAEAREKAAEARRLRERGVDPIEARQTRKMGVKAANAKTMTFDQCAASYIAAHQPGWRNAKHGAQWGATLTAYVSPVFGALPIEAVDTSLVMRALEPIWTTKPETASRVRGRIESILAWATVRGLRQGPNPAQWKNHLDHLLPARGKVRRVAHHAALPYGALPEFMALLSCRTATAACALEFVILTAARTSEVIGARWSEIDLDQRLWTIPADRMKAGREHRVPLSAKALGTLERMASVRMNDFIFPGERSVKLSNMAMLMLLRRMGLGDLTAHGFRSSFRDWAAETTAFPSEVVEMALAHTVGSKVEAAYRRGDLFDKRRQLMGAWGAFCTHGQYRPMSFRYAQWGYDMARSSASLSTVDRIPSKAGIDRQRPALEKLMALTSQDPELDAGLQQFITLAFRHGYAEGLQAGRAQGRRRAKGLPEEPSKRGHPTLMDTGRMNLLLFHIEQRPEGMSAAEAVKEFLKKMQAGGAENLPSVRAATLAVYRRQKSL